MFATRDNNVYCVLYDAEISQYEGRGRKPDRRGCEGDYQ